MKRLCLFLILFCGLAFSQDSKNGTVTTSGSDCTTAAACVSLPLASTSGAVGLSLSGTFTGTAQFEVSADNGATWVAASGTPPGSTTTATSATAAGTWRFAVSGLTTFRVRASALSAGSITVTIQSSQTSASLGGSGGGFTPPVVATQSANGADLLKCIRATDTAETGNCFKIVNAANNTTLLTLDVDGNIVANSIQLPNNQSVIFKDTGGTTRNALQYDNSDILNLYNAKNNGQINIHGNGVINIGPDSNNALQLNNNNLATMRCREFDTLNQLNGCGIGSNFATDTQIIRTWTLFDKIGGSASHTQQAVIAASGDTAGVDVAQEFCTNADTTCTNPSLSILHGGSVARANGLPTAGPGLIPARGVISPANKTAAITTTTLCSSTNCPAGTYHVHWKFIETGTACATPGTGGVTFLLTWTDGNGTAHTAISLPMDDASSLTATTGTFHFQTSLGVAWASGDFNIDSDGTANMSYATGYTACSVGTGTYQISGTITNIETASDATHSGSVEQTLVNFQGDSITENAGNFSPPASTANRVYRYPDKAMSLLATSYAFRDVGLGGEACDQMILDAPRKVDSFYHPARPKNVASNYCGINDYAIEGHGVAQIEADLQTYWTGRKNVGFTNVASTFTNNVYISGADQTSLNTYITGTLTNVDAIARLDLDAHVGFGSNLNDPNFFIDGVHPASTVNPCAAATDDGNCAIAFRFKTAFNAIGLT